MRADHSCEMAAVPCPVAAAGAVVPWAERPRDGPAWPGGHRRFSDFTVRPFDAKTRGGGIDLKTRIRTALAVVLALSPAAQGFTVSDFTAKVHTMTGNTGYTIRQADYDLRKLRGKQLVAKPGQTRRYHLDPPTAGTIAALLTLREHVIRPILAGVRSQRRGRKPAAWIQIDRDYETLRTDMQTLLHHLGITAAAAT